MDKPLTKAIIETGLVDEHNIEQLRRWGLLTTVAEVQNYKDPEVIIQRIREAIEGEDAVELRDTDLDLIKEFLAHKEKGKLCVPVSEEEDKKIVSLPVEYCATELGEIVIPWASEGIEDLLLHPKTHMKLSGGEKITFSSVREIFYDRRKAFVVCSPSKVPTWNPSKKR
jgi:predicted transcriptional regulator